MGYLVKKPSAWVPILLSAAILAMLLITLSTVGLVRHEDEGIEAHLFQIWLVLEVVLIGFFGLKWLPRMPKQALIILVLQVVFVFVAAFPVFYFNL